VIDIKTELHKTGAELRKMVEFYRQVHKRDPKAIGRIIIFALLVGALLHTIK
jgi:hypothetical protein